MNPDEGRGILTLEPLIDAVRDGVEAAGWALSGLQKTTSLQFEGRWEGQSTRSAYLFFHAGPNGDPALDAVSVDAYLDETPRGLQGNLALVTDGPPLGRLGDPREALARLGAAARACLPEGYRTPVSLRLRLPDGDADPDDSDLEIRFKLRIPATAIEVGPGAISALASTTIRAFESLAEHPEVRRYVEPG